MVHTHRANPVYALLSFLLPSVLVGFLLRNNIVSGAPFEPAELVMLSLFMLPWLLLLAYLLIFSVTVTTDGIEWRQLFFGRSYLSFHEISTIVAEEEGEQGSSKFYMYITPNPSSAKPRIVIPLSLMTGNSRRNLTRRLRAHERHSEDLLQLNLT
jgi:hypothetical protein